MLTYAPKKLEYKVLGGCWYATESDTKLKNRTSGLPHRGDTATGFRLGRYLTVFDQIIPSSDPEP